MSDGEIDKTANYCPAWIEWEVLRTPRRVPEIKEMGSLRPGVNRFSISRDDSYEIKIQFEGTATAESHMMDGPKRPGEFLKGSTVSGIDTAGARITLEEVHPGRCSMAGDGAISGDASASKLSVEYAAPQPASWKTIWCLDGPRQITLPRWTSRASEEKLTRKRDDRPGNHPAGSLEFIFPGKGGGLDHCLLNIGGATVRCCKVPEGLGPDWSRNFGIEFPEVSATPETAVTPEGIIEALSFVLGKRLIPIGQSIYAANGYPVSETARNPWSNNLSQECQYPEQFPTSILDKRGIALDEAKVSEICDKFVQASADVNFSESLSWFWMARTVPAEGNIIFLSTALESLMNAWFKSKRTKSRGKYMDDTEFKTLVEPALKLAEERLNKKEFSDRIMRRMSRANDIGPNEKMEFFFSEIGLPLTPLERGVLGRVNRYRHGGSSSDDDIEKLVLSNRAYETLYHRAMLKFISHDGTYIDYSTLGFPSRLLSEPLGGPNGDGKAPD